MAGLFDDLIPGAKPGAAGGGMFADLIPAKPKTRNPAAVANDWVIEAANAAAGGVKSVADFVAPGNAVSSFIEDKIIKPGEASQSDAVKFAKAKYAADMEAAGGIGDEIGATLGYAASNPGIALAQAAGSFAVPGAAVKGAGMLASIGRTGVAAERAAVRGGLAGGAVAGAALSGGDAAGTAYELVKKAGGTDEEASEAARKASVLPAAIGAAGGVIGAERLLAGAKGFGGGALSRALKTAGVEGAQEAIEEGVTQYEGQAAAAPYDPTIDPLKGVAGAATMGAVLGGATGGAISLLSGDPGKAKKPGVAEILGAPGLDKAIDFSLEAVTAPAKNEDKPLELATGADGLPFEADPRFAGAPILRGGERPAAPVFGSKQQADIYIGEQALFQSHEAVEVAPGRWQAQPTAATRALLGLDKPAPLPTPDARELSDEERQAYANKVPLSYSKALRNMPQPEVSDSGVSPQDVGLLPTQSLDDEGNAIPAGEAQELYRLPRNLPVSVVDPNTPPAAPRDTIPAPAPRQPGPIPTGEATEFETLPVGEVLEGDLLARDGQPFGSKTGAQAKAYASGGGKVVAIPNHFGSGIPGYVVRPLMQARPNNTRGTDARDLPRSSNDDQRDLAGSAEQVPGASDGRGADAARSGGAVGLVPAAPGRVDQPAEAPSTGNRPADVVAGAGDADTALTPGSRVTLNGTPYTVTTVNGSAVKLQGADGGIKMVARNSKTFGQIQREPNEAARPQAQAAGAEGTAPAAAPAPAAPAVVPGAGPATNEAGRLTVPVRTFGSSGYQLTMAQALAKVKELEADARRRKTASTKAPTAIMRGIEEDAASRAATLARKLREDIKQAVNSYPDARAEYAEARGEAQPASVAVEADGVDDSIDPFTLDKRTLNARIDRLVSAGEAADSISGFMELRKRYMKATGKPSIPPAGSRFVAMYPDGATPAAPAAAPGATGTGVEADGVKPRKTLQEARADAALDRPVRENGEQMTRRQWVERKVAEGLKTKVTQEDRIKPMSRMAYFRANNEEQRAHDRKVKEAGKKDVFWIGDYEVTKTEHDYANALTAEKAATPNAAAPASTEAPAPVAGEPAVVPRATGTGVETDGLKVGDLVVPNGKPGASLLTVVEQSSSGQRVRLSGAGAPQGFVRASDYTKTSTEESRARQASDKLRLDAAYKAGDKLRAEWPEGAEINSVLPDKRAGFAELAQAAQLLVSDFVMATASGDQAKADAARSRLDLVHRAVRALIPAAATPNAEALAAKKGAQPAPVATHKDPGEPAEPVTPAVVREAIKTAADNRDRPIKDVKADALRLIDEAMPNAKPADDMDVQMYEATAPGVKMTAAQQAEYKRLSGNAQDKYMERLANELAAQHQRAADNIGYVTIKVPGDGVFKVLNTAARLAEFRKKVEASPGFKAQRPGPIESDRVRGNSGRYNDRAGERFGVESGSGGKLAAFDNMVNEGDLEAASDYADAVGLVLDPAKIANATKVLKWRETRPAPAPEAAAQPEAEAPAPAVEPDPLPNPWEISQDEFVRRATFAKEGSTAFPWVAKWGDRILEAENEVFDHPDLGKTVVQGGRFSKTKREAETVARGAHKRAVRRGVLNGNTATPEALAAYPDLQPAKAAEPAPAPAPQQVAEPAPAETPADADEEAPQLSEDKARQQFEWRNLGQKNGTKTHALFFYFKPEDRGTSRSMRYGSVQQLQGESDWRVNDAGVGYRHLAPAKFTAELEAIEVLKGQGFIKPAPAPAEQAAAILNAAAEPPKGAERLSVIKDVKSGAITPEEVAAAYPAATTGTESLNKRHAIAKKQVLTPGGALKADATNSRADSAVWYYQGDMDALRFTASVKVNGEADPRADDAKRMLVQIKAAQDAGWRRANYRAGSLGTVWVFERGDEFLTRAGMENAAAVEVQRPVLSEDRAGYAAMATQQFELARAFDDWLNTLPADQQDNRGVVVRKMGETPVGDWARVEDDIGGGVALRYYEKDAPQFRIGFGARNWPELRAYVRELASRFDQSRGADENALYTLVNDAARAANAAEPGSTVPAGWVFASGRLFTGSVDAEVAQLNAAKDGNEYREFRGGIIQRPAERTASAAAPVTPMQADAALWKKITAGEATPDEFKAGFDAWVANKPAILAEFNGKTKADLLKMGGAWFTSRYKGDTKPEVVEAMWRQGASAYTLGRSFQYSMGKDSYTNGIRRMVESTDADQLAQYVAEVKAEQEQALARVAQVAEAIKDPKTLSDYNTWMRATMEAGKTFKEARMMLKPEQRAAYDELAAESSRSSRKVKQDTERTTVRAAGQTTAGEIIATKHTRDGHDLWVVKLSDRVSKDDYVTLLAGAKRLGGNYSSFRGNGAVPGFQFRTPDAAQAFLKLAGGDTAAATEVAQERRNAFEDDRSQSAAERLTEMADRLEERADESLGRDRKANTDRRARFAASAEASARADKAMATTMRNIANAIGQGGAKFLDRVRSKTQVDLLQTYVKSAHYDELRAKYPTYVEQQKREGQPPTLETADYAEFPTFTAYRSDLASLGRQLLEVDGTKKLGEQIMKVADDVSDAFTAFVKEPGNLFRLSTFSVRAGDEVRTAIFPTREGAERAIQRSGLSGKAIVFPEKRGVNRIIMSPSEAMARGIWKGDGDKRITLAPEGATALVEKIGRAARRGAKVSVPWQFERAYDRRKQLARMGIETPAEFRAALREFIMMREQPAEADKIKAMERAMIGRRNDGLDFFPTPESVADEMVAAADIQPGMRVLEPSAGMGHIAERIRATEVDPDVVEFSNDRRELLEAKGFNVVARDFMDLTEGGYDRILMNPPFSDGRDIQHVRHAYDLLKPGGRLVAIMGESAFFNQNKRATEFREWLESVGGTSEKLPEGTFNDPSLPVTTGANARMVVIEKLTGASNESGSVRGNDVGDVGRGIGRNGGGVQGERTEEPSGTGGQGAQFSRAAGARTGVPIADAEAVADAIRAAYPTGPQIVVLDDVRKAPEQLLDQIRAVQAANTVEGAYYKGKIYLFPQNVADIERLMFVGAHHEIRHAGLDALFGKRKGALLLSIAMSNPKVAEAARAKMAEGVADSMIAGTEEALADMPLEDMAKLNGWNKIVAAVRQWLRGMADRLRRNHPKLAAMIEPDQWTDNDVAALIRRAEDISRGGTVPARPGGAVFSDQDSPDWYSALAEQASKASMNAGPANAWKALLKNWISTGKVKADEVEWSGLNEWLDMTPGKITKAQVADYLRANGVQVTETVLGSSQERVEAIEAEVQELRDQREDEEDEDYRQELTDRIRALNTEKNGIKEQTKYGNYTLPGGTNYREVLLTLPEKPMQIQATPEQRAYFEFMDGLRAAHGEEWRSKAPIADRLKAAHLERLAKESIPRDPANPGAMVVPKQDRANYRSNHWDQPNVLAHIRVNDRTDADGKRVLFVEEVQSDWGQAGKKQGFKPTGTPDDAKQRGDEYGAQAQALERAMRARVREFRESNPDAEQISDDLKAWRDEQSDRIRDLMLKREEAYREAMEIRGALQDPQRPPAAPFVTATDKWVALALKRVIKMAVDGGYDKVAFVTGEQSAERYDLSKQVEAIKWRKTPSGMKGWVSVEMQTRGSRAFLESGPHKEGDLADVVGKELAERILQSQEKEGEIRGVDLKVGGEGMRAFYNKIVPSVAKDVLRKLGGGAMETVDIGGAVSGRVQDRQNPDYKPLEQPGFTITQGMKDKARGGMPLFSRADQTQTPAFRRWFGDSKVVKNPEQHRAGAVAESQALGRSADSEGAVARTPPPSVPDPLVVYHGTRENRVFTDSDGDFRIGKFSIDFTEFSKTAKANDGGFLGDGFYFSDADVANSYATFIEGDTGATAMYPVYLSLQNPLLVEIRSPADYRLSARDVAGHDGVIATHPSGSREYVAFRPEQIKSAIGNNGDFNPGSSDIRFSRAGTAKTTAQDLLNSNGGVFGRAGDTRQDRVRAVVDGSRPFWLGALTRDQIADMYGDELPPVRDYDNLTRAMENERQGAAQKADELYEEWSKIDAEANDRLARVMLDATVAQVHPDRDTLPATATEEQKQAHGRLRVQFKLLPKDAQAMYGKVRDFHANTLKDLRAALEGRIERLIDNGSERAVALADIRARFDKYMQGGPYFPLHRFGDFLVVAERAKDGERVVAAYENAGEQQAAARALEADGFAVKLRMAKVYARSTDGSAGKFIGDVLAAIDKMDMREASINGSATTMKAQLLDDLNQLFIKALPDLSYRKHFTHRKGTAGFSADVMRGFASSAFHAAGHIARLNHGDKMTFALEDAYQQIKLAPEGNFTKVDQVLNEMTLRHESALNPNVSPLSALATQVGFVMYLGLSPAAGLINMMQVPMVALPYIGARYGFAKATAAMGRAYTDIMGAKPNAKNGFNAAQSPKLSADERRAISTLQDEGVIDLTQAHDLAAATTRDVGNQARNKASFAIARAMRIVGWTFHVPEVMNRQVTALMAYRLEMAKSGNEGKAMDAAREAIKRSQFDYSSSNRARFMQGDIARVVTQFRQFSQNMTYFLGRAAYQALKGEDPEVRRIARQQLVATFLVTGAMAGSLGLPGLGFFAGLVQALVNAMGDDDDEPWDWKVAYRNALADNFGKEWGEVMARGVPRALMPAWDISNRVSLSDLWWRDSSRDSDSPREAYASDLGNILGPTAGTLLGWYTASDHMARGDYAKAVESVVPKFIRDPLKAWRESQDGVTSYNGEQLLELTGAEVAGRFLGFAPSRASEMYEGRNAVMGIKTALEDRRERLIAKMAKARIDGDTEVVAEMQQRIRDWNTENPKMAITGATIVRSVLNRRRNTANTEKGITLPDSKDFLRDRARFAEVD